MDLLTYYVNHATNPLIAVLIVKVMRFVNFVKIHIFYQMIQLYVSLNAPLNCVNNLYLLFFSYTS